MKQLSFLPSLRREHGGSLQLGRRKVARPFSHKNAIHLVLRSTKARGRWSLLNRKNEDLVQRTLDRCSRKYSIQVYRFVNVGNHLHLLIKTKARKFDQAKRDYQGFSRQFAGEVAFQVTGAKKGCPIQGRASSRQDDGVGGAEGVSRFWDRLIYSRIMSWGREFERIREYFTKNFFESQGLWTGSWAPSVELEAMLSSLKRAGVGPPGV